MNEYLRSRVGGRGGINESSEEENQECKAGCLIVTHHSYESPFTTDGSPPPLGVIHAAVIYQDLQSIYFLIPPPQADTWCLVSLKQSCQSMSRRQFCFTLLTALVVF